MYELTVFNEGQIERLQNSFTLSHLIWLPKGTFSPYSSRSDQIASVDRIIMRCRNAACLAALGYIADHANVSLLVINTLLSTQRSYPTEELELLITEVAGENASLFALNTANYARDVRKVINAGLAGLVTD
jgi:hypothetical protein